MGDDAGKRRRDARVGEQRLRLVLVGARDRELLLRRRDRRLRGRHLRFGDAIACPAPRRCPAARRGWAAAFMTAARRVAPRCATSCADSVRAEVGLRAVDFLLAALDARLVLRHHVVLQLRNLEHGEQLPGGDAIADVHVDRLHVAGDLGVHVDFLERPELGRERQRLRRDRRARPWPPTPSAARPSAGRRARARSTPRRPPPPAAAATATPIVVILVIRGPSRARAGRRSRTCSIGRRRRCAASLIRIRSATAGIVRDDRRRHRQEAVAVAEQDVAGRRRQSADSTGWPKSTMCANACETATPDANI